MPYHKTNGCRKPATHLPYGVGIPLFHHIGPPMKCLTYVYLPQSREPIGTTTGNVMPQLEHAAAVHTPAKRKPQSVRNRNNRKKNTPYAGFYSTYVRTRRNKKIGCACSMHAPPFQREENLHLDEQVCPRHLLHRRYVTHQTKRRSPTSPWLNPPSFSTAVLVLVSCI